MSVGTSNTPGPYVNCLVAEHNYPTYCIIEPGKGYFQTLAIADFSKVKGDGGSHFR